MERINEPRLQLLDRRNEENDLRLVPGARLFDANGNEIASNGAAVATLAADAPLPPRSGVTVQDDFLRGYDVVGDGSVYLCDSGPVLTTKGGTGTVSVNTATIIEQVGLGGSTHGFLSTSAPAVATNTAKAQLFGNYIGDMASVLAVDWPVIDMRVLIQGTVAATDGQAYFGIFAGTASPTLDTTPGAWFQFVWVTDHIELHGRYLNGAVDETRVIANPAVLTQWGRVVLDVAGGTITFYSSPDAGATWTQIGATIAIGTLANIQDLLYLIQYAQGGAATAATIFTEFFRLDVTGR